MAAKTYAEPHFAGAVTPTGSVSYQAVWPRWTWQLVLVLVAVDVALILSPRVSLVRESWPFLLNLIACVAALLTLVRKCPMGIKTYTLLTGLAMTLTAWPALRVLNHISMTVKLPLADDQLSRWDAALGLDWLDYVRWLDRHPLLLEVMAWTYGGLVQYSCAAFAGLLLWRSSERAVEFVCLFLSSATFAILAGPLLPAAGAMIFYAPAPAEFDNVRTTMGTYFWEPLLHVRSADHLDLVVTQLPGLVAFPSFHTAMGVIMIYCARGGLLLFVPVLALNAIMIASTPLFGGHYFVDVLGGMATAGALILAHRALHRSASVPSLRPRDPSSVAAAG